MTEIRFSDIFKNKKSYMFKEYNEGLYNYIPLHYAQIYGMKSEEEFPDEIFVRLYINKAYIGIIAIKKGEELYNKMLTETYNIPIFVGLEEDIPDNTFWSIEHKGIVREKFSYWYKDGKFFSIGNRYIRHTDEHSEINNKETFFKDLENVAKEYLEWGNYKHIENIKLVRVKPVLRNNSKPIHKLRHPVLDIDPEKIYTIDKDGIVGAKYIGKSDKYNFEIFLKNESGDWISEGLIISRDDTNTFIPGVLTYSGRIIDLDLGHTCIIISNNNDIIPISFINGNVALYDYVAGKFREMNDADWDALDNIDDIYQAGFNKIEGGDTK